MSHEPWISEMEEDIFFGKVFFSSKKPEKTRNSSSHKRKSPHCSNSEAGSVLQKKVVSNISQNSPENTCARVSFLIKLQASASAGDIRVTASVSFIKPSLLHSEYPLTPHGQC